MLFEWARFLSRAAGDGGALAPVTPADVGWDGRVAAESTDGGGGGAGAVADWNRLEVREGVR